MISAGAIRAMNRKGERLLLFMGIIDILQSYRLVKKVEHAWKSILYDGVSLFVCVWVCIDLYCFFNNFFSLPTFFSENNFSYKTRFLCKKISGFYV